jgi:photosystem II stability/assembly factor-like uncharacterized protein
MCKYFYKWDFYSYRKFKNNLIELCNRFSYLQRLPERWFNRLLISFIIVSISSFTFLTISCNNKTHIVSPPILLPPQPPVQQSTWDFVGLAGEDDIWSIEIVPDKPWIIYVGIMSDFSGGTKGKILKSTDWGSTWKKIADSISVGKIILDPKNENILYAGLNPNNDCIPGVIKSTNAGESWFRIDSVMQLTWEEGAAISIDPTNSNVLYAYISGYFGGGMFKSTDAGNTWFMLPPKWEGRIPPLADGVTCFSIDPKNPNELYLGMSWSGYIMKSYDGGETFGVVHDSSEGLPSNIVVNPVRTNVVYLGYFDGGFRKSNNHGISWEREKSGLPYRSIDRLAFYKDSTIFVGSGWDNNGGVFASRDDGATWNKIGSLRIYALSIDEQNRFLYVSYGIASNSGIYRYKITQ